MGFIIKKLLVSFALVVIYTTTIASSISINGHNSISSSTVPTRPLAFTPSSLIDYFNSIAGSHTISGQFIEFGPFDPIVEIYNNTGKWLGLIGGDYWWYGSTQNTATYDFNQYAINYFNAGGLVIVTCSMPNPTTMGPLYDLSNLNVQDLLTSGTDTNNNFVGMLGSIAQGLQQLQKAGVVVIFRPFHEANGNWFWWGTTFLSDDQFVQVWQYVWNFMTNQNGLNNLVWLQAFNTGMNGDTNRYAGDNYVDVVGQDLYTSNPEAGQNDYNTLMSLGKPVCLSEFGSGGPTGGDPNFNETNLIVAIQQTMPNTVFWQQWWDENAGNEGWGMASVQDAGEALNDPWVLNREDLAYSMKTTASAPSRASPSDLLYRSGEIAPVSTPLEGDVTQGSWTYDNLNGMEYLYLLPSNYTTDVSYPLILYLHQDDMGTPFYQGNDILQGQIDPWFNNDQFRTNNPCIVVAPLLDQTNDPSGETINFGGYGGGNDPTQGEQNSVAIAQLFISNFSVNPNQVYVAGNSMGGSGTWDIMIRWNTQNGKWGQIFKAGLSLAGISYDFGTTSPDPNLVSQMSSVPIGCIHGASDDDQPASTWDLPMFWAQGGSGTPSSWTQAGNSQMWLLVDPNLGHDVWDTYFVEPTSDQYWAWLFSQ